MGLVGRGCRRPAQRKPGMLNGRAGRPYVLPGTSPCGTSLRAGGRPAVTAEILLDRHITSLRVAQFKGLYGQHPMILRCITRCVFFCATSAPDNIRSIVRN